MVRALIIVLIGVIAGGLMGHFGQCAGGTCPLTSTWWRGALYGGVLAAIIVFGNRTS